MIGNIDYMAQLADKFDTMQPFEFETDIPKIPNVDIEFYKNNIEPNLIRCGAIPKEKLIKNKLYLGSSNVTTEAMWKGNCFVFLSEKWGTQVVRKVGHFQDYVGSDVFIPIQVID